MSDSGSEWILSWSLGDIRDPARPDCDGGGDDDAILGSEVFV